MRFRFFTLLLLFYLSLTSYVVPQLLMTQEDALKSIFPDSQKVTRHTIFLEDDQVEKIQNLARFKLESKIVSYYTDADGKNAPTAFVFFEKSTVRTKDAIFMVVLNPDGTTRLIKMLAFYEPFDYMPIPRWFKLFNNREFDSSLWPDRGIDTITGATLTVHAVTFGVRKILATYIVAINSH